MARVFRVPSWASALVLVLLVSPSSAFFRDMFKKASSAIIEGANSVYDDISKGRCRFHENFDRKVKMQLEDNIIGQDWAISEISRSIGDWKLSGRKSPLVLSLVGPTGVGKSQSAYEIGAGALAHTDSASGTPRGYLVLNGEDFAYCSGKVEEIRNQIRRRVIDHLSDCPHGAVVVFDEIEKACPELHQVFKPCWQTGGRLDVKDPQDPQQVNTAWCGKTIFILISDIGSNRLVQLLQATEPSSSLGKASEPSESVSAGMKSKSKLLRQLRLEHETLWENRDLSKLIDTIVPYQYFTFESIQPVTQYYLERMLSPKESESERVRFWTDASISDSCVQWLAAEYLTYQRLSLGGGQSPIALLPQGARELATSNTSPRMVLYAGLKEAYADFLQQVCQQPYMKNEDSPCSQMADVAAVRDYIATLDGVEHTINLNINGVMLEGSQAAEACGDSKCRLLEFSTCIYRRGTVQRKTVDCFQLYFDPIQEDRGLQ